MEKWLEIRIEYLHEMIRVSEEKLTKYRNIDLSGLDNFNKDHLNKTIETLEKNILHYTDEIKLINSGKYAENQ